MMGGRDAKTWAEEIKRHSTKWTVQDAGLFLSFLVEKVGVANTLKRMNTLSYLFRRGITYHSFDHTYAVLSRWVGEEAVIKKMGKSLNGFQYEFSEDTAAYFLNFFRNDKSDPWDMIELLKASLADDNSEGAKALISSLSHIFEKKGRPRNIDRESFLSRLKENFDQLGVPSTEASLFINFVDDYLHSWNVTRVMMLKNFGDFAQIDTNQFAEAVTWLRERGISEDTIKETFRDNAAAARRVDKGKLEKVTGHMQTFFGGDGAKEKVDTMMLHNLGSFVQIDTDKFAEVVTWLKERGFPEDAIKNALRRNARAASLVDKDKLEEIAGYLQTFFGGDGAKEQVDIIMLSNLGDFARIDISKFSRVVAWLKGRGIPEDTIRETFKGNASAASLVDKGKLQEIARHMQAFFRGDGAIEGAKEKVDTMMLNNLSSFVQIDTDKFDEAIIWLKGRGISEDAIKNTFRRNARAASLADKGKLEENAGYLQAFFGGDGAKKYVDSMMLHNLSAFVQIDTGKFAEVAIWLKGRGIPEDTVREIFEENALAASLANKGKLKKIARHMQTFFGGNRAKEKVNSMMFHNLGAFIEIDTAKFDEVVTWLKGRGIPEDTIKETFRDNAAAASSANKDKLEKVAGHMQTFFGGDGAIEGVKEKVDSMMLQNLAAFIQIDTKKFDEVVTYLKERGISEERIKQAFGENVAAAVMASREKLEMVSGQMDNFFAGKEVDIDSLLEKMTEADCRTLTNLLCL